MENYEDKLWVEKYRPKRLEDLVIPDDYRKIFQEIINSKKMGHLLLAGPPGCGKTTLARIILKELIKDKADLMTLNGSVTTGVENIRSNVSEFLKAMSFGNTCKIVFIDEADYLSQNAQASLRGIIEEYTGTGRFLFTANYISKFLPPILSRMQAFEFKRLPLEYVKKYCVEILTKENVKFELGALDKVISNFYPDIRKIINVLQSRSETGNLLIQESDINSNESKFSDLYEEMIRNVDSERATYNIQELYQIASNGDIDYAGLYKTLFSNEKLPFWCKLIVNKYASQHISAMIPAMNLMSMVYQSYESGNELIRSKKGR